MSIRLLQLRNPTGQRRIAFVEEPRLRLLNSIATTYDLAVGALKRATTMSDLLEDDLGDTTLDYDEVHNGASDWKILPPFDHPTEPARCIISGTGLTHLGSAKNRDAMHENAPNNNPKPAASGGAGQSTTPSAQGTDTHLTDSMRMFRWGVESGKPAAGHIGIAPEWFYKGTGTMVRAHNEPIDLPAFADDGGEEAEVAGLYLIDDAGRPVRVGMAQGNEYSDHVFEKKNYLNLAGSKLRQCALGPELVIGPDFSSVPGHARVMRPEQGEGAVMEKIIWSKAIATGEAEMCHSLANMEHHHFKFDCHRRPGDVHVHFFGACALSFGDGIKLRDGDIMQVHFKGFGRPLRNPLRAAAESASLTVVRPLL